MTVHTDDGDFQAKGLVLACGPWSSEILSNIGVFLPLKVSELYLNIINLLIVSLTNLCPALMS